MEKPNEEEIQYQLAHYKDNYVDEVHVSMSICLALAAIAVILRVVARRMSKASIGKDDHMIFVALFFAASYVTANFVDIRLGGMRHAVTMKHPEQVAKTIMAIEVLYQPSICCVKLSCLLLLHRLFPNGGLHITIWCVGIAIMLYTTICMFTTIFACRPIRAAWDLSVTDAQCLDLNLEYIVQAILNVVTDFIILLLPMPILWGLHLDRSKKLQLMGIFLTGSFVCAVSIWRVPHMKLANQDASYADVPAAIWSGVEVCVGIVGACLPTLRPIATWLSRTVTKSVTKRSPANSAPSTSYGRAESKNLDDLDLQALRSPPSTYTPSRTMGTVTRIEAPAFDRSKKNRISEQYWKLEAGENNV